MSRYNHPLWELFKPFYWLFFLLVVTPLFILLYLILSIIFGTEKAYELIDGWLDDGLTESGGEKYEQ